MDEIKYYCYICDEELTDTNNSDEHIILNSIGGHLHSKQLLCKKCNSKLGDTADAKLAEDLSFYTDMLKVKKVRKNPHKQIMLDDEGCEVVVNEAGAKIELRRPYKKIDKDKGQDNIRIHITARNEKELMGILNSLVREGTISQEEADKLINKAVTIEYRPILHKRNSISQEAFPSIIKSAVNYYLYKTQDTPRIKHLIPYILGEKDAKEVLYLHHFKKLPYDETKEGVTHMIHIEGDKDTALLYAMMEYYGIFIYIVVLDSDYHGDYINETYTYDTIEGCEINRTFSLPLTLEDLNVFREQPYDEYVKNLPYIKERCDRVMNIWQRRKDHEELSKTIEKAFGKYPDGCIITQEMISKIEDEIMKFIENKLSSQIQ